MATFYMSIKDHSDPIKNIIEGARLSMAMTALDELNIQYKWERMADKVDPTTIISFLVGKNVVYSVLQQLYEMHVTVDLIDIPNVSTRKNSHIFYGPEVVFTGE